MGWSFYPDGLKKLIGHVHRRTGGLPIYITENGLADRADLYRSQYLAEHLRVIGECIQQGNNVRGYYHWSLLDNFEWIKGFGPRFGLIEVDYSSFERRIRRSGHFLKKVIGEHRISQELIASPHPEKLSQLIAEELRAQL
jgi:beta-glucosidase/6-phospho-beta-glucosidase/beta-galactosidase